MDPTTVEAHTLLGNFLLKAKRADEAVAAYRAALALDPDHQGATWSLALAYKQIGRLAEAEAGFLRLRTLDPRASRALWQLAEIWMQQGRFDRALPALRAGLAQGADRPAFLQKLGECLIEMKRLAEAESTLREALAARATLTGAHFNLALVREAQGDGPGAIAEYERELQTEPKAFRAAFNLGRLLLKSGRPADAAVRLKAAVEANPSFGTGQLYLAKALFDQGDLAGAEAAARAGLANSPEPAVAPLGHYVLADVHTRRGQTEAAGRELAAARKLERGS